MGAAEHLPAAALYAAFAAALLALAHRLLVRLTWRAALCLALLPLCFTGRALLAGETYAPVDLAYSGSPFSTFAAQYGIGKTTRRGVLTDVYSANYPWRQAVRYAVRQGEWPLWNPFILCGDPLAGSAQSAPYYPVNALSLLLPIALAFTFGAAAQLLVAALGAFLYLRDLGCREVAALLGAMGWAFASFNVFWLEWSLGAAVALAPLVLFGARRVVVRPGWPSALLLAGALALAILAGHPESAVHLVVLGAILGIAEAAAAPPRRWGAIAGWTAVAGALALAVSAVYFLPLLEVLRQTFQWLLRQDVARLSAANPAAAAGRRLLASVVPATLDLPRQDPSPPLVLPLVSAYAGSVLWGPALYGLVRGPWRGRFVLAAVGLLGVCAGAKMPGVYPLLGHLPLLSMTINDRLVFAGALSTVLLAALGVEAWLQAEERGAAARASRELAAACAASAAAFLAAAAYLVPVAHAYGYPSPGLLRWGLWGLLPLLGVLLLSLGVGSAAARRLSRRPLACASVALVAVLAVQRGGEIGSFYPSVPARAFYPRVAPLDTLDDLLRRSDQPWRIVGEGFHLIPNQGAFYEMEDLRGYQAIFHLRFAEVMRLWGNLIPSWFLEVRDATTPFVSLANVRYVLSAPNRPFPGYRLVARGADSLLWENPRALPRAFVPRRVRFGVRPDREVDEMGEETDFGRLAWIAPPAGGAATPAAPAAAPSELGDAPREEPNGRGWVITRRHGLGLSLTARMKQAGWVVITETAWNGWRARLDGREVPLGIGDHTFLALALPAGWHTAELFYRPRSFELGRAVSFAALVLIAAVSLARRMRRRRGPEERAAR